MYEMVSIQIKITRMTTSITSEVLVKQGLTNKVNQAKEEKKERFLNKRYQE